MYVERFLYSHKHLPRNGHQPVVLSLLLYSSPARVDFTEPELEVPPMGDDVAPETKEDEHVEEERQDCRHEHLFQPQYRIISGVIQGKRRE